MQPELGNRSRFWRWGLLLATLASSSCAEAHAPPAQAVGPPPRAEVGSEAPRPRPGGEAGDGAAGAADAASAGSCDLGQGALPPAVVARIERALLDEWRAAGLYEAFVDELARAGPFRRIVDAERRHVVALRTLLAAHGHEIPAKPSVLSRPVDSLTNACLVGVESEKVTVSMYDELLAAELPRDVRCVFTHMRAAASRNHLPAFERCEDSR
jgi:hypothetical protein